MDSKTVIAVVVSGGLLVLLAAVVAFADMGISDHVRREYERAVYDLEQAGGAFAGTREHLGLPAAEAEASSPLTADLDAAEAKLREAYDAVSQEGAELLAANREEDEPRLQELTQRARAARQEAVGALDVAQREIERARAAAAAVEEQREAEAARLSAAEEELADHQAAVERVLADHQVLAPLAAKEGWLDALDEASAALAAVQEGPWPEAEAAVAEVAPTEPETVQAAEAALQEVATARSAATGPAAEVHQAATALGDFVANKDARLSEARELAATIAGVALAELRAEVERAAADFSHLADDLRDRFAGLEAMQAEAPGTLAELEEVATQPLSAEQPVRLKALLAELDRAADLLPAEKRALEETLAGLYVAEDRILTDMEIREGEEVEFFHEYTTYRVEADGATDVDSEWVEVSEREYLEHEAHLGMVVWSRPAGVLTPITYVSPPGYAYVGNPYYGEWDDDDDEELWEFDDDRVRIYHFGKKRKHRITRGDYRTYRSYRDRSQVYFDVDDYGDPIYGSRGSYTRRRHSDARYVAHDGYARSRYKTSGGTYQGARWEREQIAKKRAAERARQRRQSSYRRGSRSSSSSWGGK